MTAENKSNHVLKLFRAMCAVLVALALLNLVKTFLKDGNSYERCVRDWCSVYEDTQWVRRVKVRCVDEICNLGEYTDPDYAVYVAVRDSLASVRDALSLDGRSRRLMLEDRERKLEAAGSAVEKEALREQTEWLRAVQGETLDPMTVASIFGEVRNMDSFMEHAALEPGRMLSVTLIGKGRKEDARFVTPSDVMVLTRIDQSTEY